MNCYRISAISMNNGEITKYELKVVKMNNKDWKEERRPLNFGKDIKYEEGYKDNNECAYLTIYLIAKNKKEAIAKALLKLFFIGNIKF